MSDISNFSTAILTSKSPQQSASLVNQGIQQTNELVATHLIGFFDNYSSILQRNNHDLKKLVDNHAQSITALLNSTRDFGITTQVWDNYANSLKNEIHSNDQLIRSLKLEVLGPLINLVKQDARFSELLINNNELMELVTQEPLNEYKWNTASLQILNNFENFKKHEKNVLFTSFLNLFNLQSSILSRGIKINESSTNYLLNNFNVDQEMDKYLDVLLKTDQPPLEVKPQAAPTSRHAQPPPPVKPKKQNRQSRLFHSHSDSASITSDKEKRNSKLKSRVGSIFGRKSKSKKASTTVVGIPELESIHSATTSNTALTNLTALRNERTRDELSRDNTPTMNAPSSFANNTTGPETPLKPEPKYQGNFGPNSNNVSRQRDLPPLTTQKVVPLPQPATSSPPQSPPNVVKYDGDSGSDEETEKKPSLLQQHNLAQLQQPASDTLNTSKSRQTQYSFESGDDNKPIATSPRVQKNETFDFPDPDLDPEPQTNGHAAPAEPQLAQSSGEHTAPLPPPPRKVAHRDTAPSVVAKKRSEVNSQIFQSLPGARESVINPNPPSMLSSQTTGTSLLSKQDLFNHNDLLNHSGPGINSSVSQVINVNFRSNKLVKSSIVGEIAFNYQGEVTSDSLNLTIPKNNFTKTILNTLFVERVSEESFKVIPAYIANKTLGGIKYMQQNLDISQIPIIVHSVWKYEEHQSSLLVTLELNPSFPTSHVTVSNLVLSVALDKTVETTSASSRPQGSFNKEKNRITWRFTEPLVLSKGKGEKLIARFMTNGEGSEDESGIQLKFSISEIPSPLELYSGSLLIPSAFNLNAGNYSFNS